MSLLDLVAHLPSVELSPDDVLITEDTTTGSMWVLVEGRLEIRKHGAAIQVIDRPGATLGEVAALTESSHSASVVAVTPARLHVVADGRALLREHPELLLFIATELAERLDVVTTYLADLRNQYADTPGIEMVSHVIGRLSHAPAKHTPGSARDPDPEY